MGVSIREYFDNVLPALLRWRAEEASKLGVTVRFAVSGRGGGTWTVRLRPPVPGVVRGSEWKADLQVKITSGQMANILRGKFVAADAIRAGEIELQGDISVLRQLGFLFQTTVPAAEALMEPPTRRAGSRA